MSLTAYHARYFAHELTKRSSSASIDSLTSALADAQVDEFTFGDLRSFKAQFSRMNSPDDYRTLAFVAKDHRRITEHIMGDRFDPRLFKLVNDYIDKEKGRDHRERHGHNLEAEKYIKETWGDDGVEIFRIHILSDLLYDDLGPVVSDV